VTLAARCVAQSSAGAQQAEPAGFRRRMPAELSSVMSNNSRRRLGALASSRGGERWKDREFKFAQNAGVWTPENLAALDRSYENMYNLHAHARPCRLIAFAAHAIRHSVGGRLRNGMECCSVPGSRTGSATISSSPPAWRQSSRPCRQSASQQASLGGSPRWIPIVLNDAMVRLAAAQDAADAARVAATEAERRP
jgi:hypothetical protein